MHSMGSATGARATAATAPPMEEGHRPEARAAPRSRAERADATRAHSEPQGSRAQRAQPAPAPPPPEAPPPEDSPSEGHEGLFAYWRRYFSGTAEPDVERDPADGWFDTFKWYFGIPYRPAWEEPEHYVQWPPFFKW